MNWTWCALPNWYLNLRGVRWFKSTMGLNINLWFITHFNTLYILIWTVLVSRITRRFLISGDIWFCSLIFSTSVSSNTPTFLPYSKCVPLIFSIVKSQSINRRIFRKSMGWIHSWRKSADTGWGQKESRTEFSERLQKVKRGELLFLRFR